MDVKIGYVRGRVTESVKWLQSRGFERVYYYTPNPLTEYQFKDYMTNTLTEKPYIIFEFHPDVSTNLITEFMLRMK